MENSFEASRAAGRVCSRQSHAVERAAGRVIVESSAQESSPVEGLDDIERIAH